MSSVPSHSEIEHLQASRQRYLPSVQRERGIGMIEILITVLLISFGILSMAYLHSSSFQYMKMAQFRGIATQLAFEVTDRMRANITGAIGGNYNFLPEYPPNGAAPTPTAPACFDPPPQTPCASVEIATFDLDELRNMVRGALPGGELQITQDAANNNVFSVWIIWRDVETHGNNENDTSTTLACPDNIGALAPPAQCLAMRAAL